VTVLLIKRLLLSKRSG